MFDVHLLPATNGDSMIIEYGNVNQPRRLLLDGGTAGTTDAIMEKAFDDSNVGAFELVVVSHVDNDHIAGVLKLFEERDLHVKARDVWFNGFRHLDESDLESLGFVQGERLTTQLSTPGVSWNQDFHGRAVKVGPDHSPVERNLPGKLKISVLSPSSEELLALKVPWGDIVAEENLNPDEPVEEEQPQPGGGLERLGSEPPPETPTIAEVETLAATDYDEDSKPANGSSIAVLIEHDGRRILVSGDARSSVLLKSLEKLSPGEPIEVDALHVPHHGSKANVSMDLLKKVKTPLYLFSTNGSSHDHPDQETVARVLKSKHGPATLVFNYRSDENKIWDDQGLKDHFGYETRYPEEDGAASKGVTLKL